METAQEVASSRSQRELANLKLLSRLLGHELHAQNGPRISMSRAEVTEVQTAIDLYIEAAQGLGGSRKSVSAPPIPARMS